MRNRFLKVILFHLRDYGLSNDDEMRIKKGVQKGFNYFNIKLTIVNASTYAQYVCII